MYNVHLIYSHGNNSLLSVRGRSEWKTKKIAINHAENISKVNSRAGMMKELQAIIVEDDCGDIIKSFAI